MDRQAPPAALTSLTMLDALLIAGQLSPRYSRDIRQTRFGASLDSWAVGRVQSKGVSYCLTTPDGPVAMGGVEVISPGVGNAWFALGTWNKPPVKALLRTCRGVLQAVIASGECHRIQAMTYSNDVVAGKFAAHLGFRFEHTVPMASYDRRDMDLWSFLEGRDAKLAG